MYDEGFNSINELVETERGDFLEIEGFDEAIVDAIMLRAKDAFAQINAEYEAKLEQCDKKLLDILSDENSGILS